MKLVIPPAPRVLKTRWFVKAARKAGIADAALCEAIWQVQAGQADDLGGGVWKKRLNRNRHRAIILAEGGHYWVYEYLFAKSDRSNIDDDELAAFRTLAKVYEGLKDHHVTALLNDEGWKEIYIDHQA